MRAILVVFAGIVALGCGPRSHQPADGGSDAGPPPEIPPVGATASETIGSEGGTLALGDFELVVPAGALSTPTEIRVTVIDAVPSTFTGFSPVFRFEPDGLSFAEPIRVRLPFLGDTSTATVFWTTAGSTEAYAPLRTTVEGRIAIVDATHFSTAFVGTACTGTDCCSRANGELDVLLMVDNSNSMGEEQGLLNAQIPRMARALATGDIDADGVQDVPAVRSLRIGSITSDMGVGGAAGVPTCSNADFGDDGVLRTQGAESAECSPSYPVNYAELDTSDPGASIDAFVTQVGCVARPGVNGCGFEQQLDAVLKALTPSSSPTRFVLDSTGQGDRANAGFLRESSILATVLLTDENDCSAVDPRIFDLTAGSTYSGTDVNLRCWAHAGAALHPVARYVDGLRALRTNPDDSIFAVIAGVPVDLVQNPDAVDYDALLADPRMIEQVNPLAPNQLAPACNTEIGIAFPATRLVQVARGFGANGVVQSICQSDFTPVIDAILTRVARRVSGACGAP